MTKTLTTGRKYLVNYGSTIRKRHTFYRAKALDTYVCNVCHSTAVIRVSSGLWTCKKCKDVFTGDAYTP